MANVEATAGGPAPGVISDYFRALDTEDWALLRTLFCEDAEVRAVGTSARFGIDAVMAFYQRLFRPWAQHRDAPTRVLRDGDTLTVEVQFTGTTPDGVHCQFDAVDVIDLRDGRIARLTNWYDLVAVRQALGLDASPTLEAGTR
jgi:ketosteroid isomerase-like protein